MTSASRLSTGTSCGVWLAPPPSHPPPPPRSPSLPARRPAPPNPAIPHPPNHASPRPAGPTPRYPLPPRRYPVAGQGWRWPVATCRHFRREFTPASSTTTRAGRTQGSCGGWTWGRCIRCSRRGWWLKREGSTRWPISSGVRTRLQPPVLPTPTVACFHLVLRRSHAKGGLGDTAALTSRPSPAAPAPAAHTHAHNFTHTACSVFMPF